MLAGSLDKEIVLEVRAVHAGMALAPGGGKVPEARAAHAGRVLIRTCVRVKGT